MTLQVPHQDHVVLPDAFNISADDMDLATAIARPWFAPVQQQLNRMETNLAKWTNATNGDGSLREFVIVRFNNGTDPTAPPNNIPRLASVVDIDSLSMANANRYLVGYGIERIPNTVAARRRLVKINIGCRAL